MTGCVSAVVLIAWSTSLHFSQGWVQFGYRFSNDFAPFALVLVALGHAVAGARRLARPAGSSGCRSPSTCGASTGATPRMVNRRWPAGPRDRLPDRGPHRRRGPRGARRRGRGRLRARLAGADARRRVLGHGRVPGGRCRSWAPPTRRGTRPTRSWAGSVLLLQPSATPAFRMNVLSAISSRARPRSRSTSSAR